MSHNETKAAGVDEKDRWRGKAICQYEFCCYACHVNDYISSTTEARELGWKHRKVGGWHCPDCVAKSA